jgi:hypothetical protein
MPGHCCLCLAAPQPCEALTPHAGFVACGTECKRCCSDSDCPSSFTCLPGGSDCENRSGCDLFACGQQGRTCTSSGSNCAVRALGGVLHWLRDARWPLVPLPGRR